MRTSFVRHIAIAALSLLLMAGEHVCRAQDLPSGDLRSVNNDTVQDTTSLNAKPVFPPMMFGMSAISRPLGTGFSRPLGTDGLPMPEGPLTAQDIFNLKLAKISGGLYPSMQENFAASMWTPSKGAILLYTIAGLFMTPQISVPYGYWAFNPSFPFALTKIPESRDYASMYDPLFIPQMIRTIRDEQSGIFVQEAIPWEEAYKNVNGWHLGGTNTAPLNLGPMNPVEREVQRINSGHGF